MNQLKELIAIPSVNAVRFEHYVLKIKTQRPFWSLSKIKKQQQEVRESLSSEEGNKKYRSRKIDVEPVFGQIKHNRKFNWFSLRGLSKNTTDIGVLFVLPTT